LLRARRERPRCRRAAQSQDELAPFHRDDPKPEDHAEYSRSRPCIAAKAGCSCPLWVMSRHHVFLGRCLLCPRKQTLLGAVGMSA
jgi:hypothetical protein